MVEDEGISNGVFTAKGLYFGALISEGLCAHGLGVTKGAQSAFAFAQGFSRFRVWRDGPVG